MLAPWKESYDQPRHIKREHIKRQIHYFASKGPLVKAMVFPIVMYGCESWTLRKAEPKEASEELMLSNCGAGEDS